jgi:hypothetical protein
MITLAPAPGGSGQNAPPYPAPAETVYPEHAISNAGSLFRPRRLPADMDLRVDKSSVWMGMDKNTRMLSPRCLGVGPAGCTAKPSRRSSDILPPVGMRTVHGGQKPVLRSRIPPLRALYDPGRAMRARKEVVADEAEGTQEPRNDDANRDGAADTAEGVSRQCTRARNAILCGGEGERSGIVDSRS